MYQETSEFFSWSLNLTTVTFLPLMFCQQYVQFFRSKIITNLVIVIITFQRFLSTSSGGINILEALQAYLFVHGGRTFKMILHRRPYSGHLPITNLPHKSLSSLLIMSHGRPPPHNPMEMYRSEAPARWFYDSTRHWASFKGSELQQPLTFKYLCLPFHTMIPEIKTQATIVISI